MDRPSIALPLCAVFLTSCTSTLPEWHEEPRHLSLFLGGTEEDQETGGTVGLDYEQRVTDLIGVGAVAEYAGGEVDAWTFLGVADIHVWEGLAIQTGPGLEHIDGTDWFVYRIGALYEFELGEGVTLSPQVHVDLTAREDAFVAGVAIGRAF